MCIISYLNDIVLLFIRGEHYYFYTLYIFVKQILQNIEYISYDQL